MHHRESNHSSLQLEENVLSEANPIILARLELAAFAGAVGELFGSEQARLSVSQWIDELELMDWPSRPGVSDFRRVTIATSARLAHQLYAPPHDSSRSAYLLPE